MFNTRYWKRSMDDFSCYMARSLITSFSVFYIDMAGQYTNKWQKNKSFLVSNARRELIFAMFVRRA